MPIKERRHLLAFHLPRESVHGGVRGCSLTRRKEPSNVFSALKKRSGACKRGREVSKRAMRVFKRGIKRHSGEKSGAAPPLETALMRLRHSESVPNER